MKKCISLDCGYNSPSEITLNRPLTTFKVLVSVVPYFFSENNTESVFSSPDMQIKGKKAVVIAGAQGIGLAYCKALLRNGAKVKLQRYELRNMTEDVTCMWTCLVMNDNAGCLGSPFSGIHG